MDGVDEVVMEMESALKVVTSRGLLQRIMTSIIYTNGRVTTFYE